MALLKKFDVLQCGVDEYVSSLDALLAQKIARYFTIPLPCAASACCVVPCLPYTQHNPSTTSTLHRYYYYVCICYGVWYMVWYGMVWYGM
jgi:hypothetical protein